MSESGRPRASSPAPAGESSGPNVIGRTIQGRYLIKRLIGEGGMGGVYEAEHIEIGRRVALKLVHTAFARNEQIAARLKQEARSTGAIESAHIVQVFDAGDDPTCGLYLVMELLQGKDLGHLLETLGQLPITVACGVILQAARGLSRAHAAKIVHRDLKPANIFVCKQDDGSALIKLVDFGIAKMLRDAQETAHSGALTRVGLAIGTPQYMSPEQAQGLPNIDGHTDIYSLGAVLFEAIAGRPPFAQLASYEQTILQIMTSPTPRLSSAIADIPHEVDELCARMMAKEPSARFANMAEVAEAILATFPELETSPLPYRILSSGPGTGPGVGRHLSSPSIFERPPRTAAGGVVSAASARRAPTSAGVTLTPFDADDARPAGLPTKGRGIKVASGLLLTTALLGALLFMKIRGGPSATDVPHGVVQPTAMAPPQQLAAAASAPLAVTHIAPPAAPPEVAIEAPLKHVKSPVAARETSASAKSPQPSRAPTPVDQNSGDMAAQLRAAGLPGPAPPPAPTMAAAPAATPRAPTEPPPAKGERVVGGTDPSTEF